MDYLKEPLVAAYLTDCKIRGMSPRSFPGYHAALRAYMRYLNENSVSLLNVGQDNLIDFIRYLRLERQVAQRTIELTFSVISSLYEYLIFAGHLEINPVLPVRKRYLKRYKNNGDPHERQLISIEAMAGMITATMNIRDRAILTMLAKTGMRRNELISLDVADVNFIENSLRLKPTAKRSNRTLFMDDECSFALRRWLTIRAEENRKNSQALFLNQEGDRIQRSGVSDVVYKAASRVGLHNPASERMEEHFSPHCCRHWFTTHLRRAGMRREFIQELRGDARREAIDIYDHIDLKELKEAYLACIPQLGI
jgi:integrase/recombinase XerD